MDPDLAARLPDGIYVVKPETDRSYDYNTTYARENPGVGGKPSLVYQPKVSGISTWRLVTIPRTYSTTRRVVNAAKVQRRDLATFSDASPASSLQGIRCTRGPGPR